MTSTFETKFSAKKTWPTIKLVCETIVRFAKIRDLSRSKNHTLARFQGI